eukprot:351625-Chlamydomonas_euryale.AAC.6
MPVSRAAGLSGSNRGLCAVTKENATAHGPEPPHTNPTSSTETLPVTLTPTPTPAAAALDLTVPCNLTANFNLTVQAAALVLCPSRARLHTQARPRRRGIKEGLLVRPRPLQSAAQQPRGWKAPLPTCAGSPAARRPGWAAVGPRSLPP